MSEIIIPEKVIYLVRGSGRGMLEKTAYDAALWDAGIANFNIIPLSSVFPPGCRLVRKKLDWNLYGKGRELKVVESFAVENRAGYEAIAGVGWVEPEGDNAGVFLELYGDDYNELRMQMSEGLEEMRGRRGLKGTPKMVIQRTVCERDETYAGALVSALYKIEVIKNV